MSSPQVWLITGTSSGFGAAFVKILLERGDKVIATARTISKIAHLKQLGAATLQLDVTDSAAEIEPEDWQAQFKTNLFGAINTTRAFLPHFRSNMVGTVIFVGSAAALSGMPVLSLYCASKFALTGAAESLAQEIAPLGIRTLIVQPGFFRTEFLNESNTTYIETKFDEYKQLTDGAYGQFRGANGKQPGDPEKGASRVIDVVKGEGLSKGKEFPTTLMLGADVWSMAKKKAETEIVVLNEWEQASSSLDYE